MYKISKVILCGNKNSSKLLKKKEKKKRNFWYTAKVFIGDQEDVDSVSSSAVWETLLLFTVQKSSHPNNRRLVGTNKAITWYSFY